MKSILIKMLKKKRILNYKLLKLKEELTGLDLVKYVNHEDLGFTLDTGYRYEWSSSKYLKKVLKDLNISNNDSIIDLGCGKGAALICFSKFPFKKSVGIELSKELTEICR